MMNEIAVECTVPFEYEDPEEDCDCAAECSDINVTEEESTWTKTTIGYLLEECLKKKKELHDPRHRRNRFFSDIREKMIARGFLFSTKTLEKKFHNLKKHFCTICQNRDRATTPGRPITWPYYEKMMEIFAEELEIEDAPTMASLYPELPPPKNAVDELKPKPDPDPPSSDSQSDDGETQYIDHGDDGEETAWTHKSVVIFLRECSKRKYDLFDPQIRRRKIFNDIRHRLRAKGFKFHPESLDRKLRNMKKHFQVVRDSSNRVNANGRRRKVTWPYYNQLKEIYGEEMEREMANIKTARKSIVTLPPPPQCILPSPPSTMKFRPIAPKAEIHTTNEMQPTEVQYIVAVPVPGQIVTSTTNDVVEEIHLSEPSKVECSPSSPGDFDRSCPSQDEISMPPTYEEESEKKPISFEVTLHNEETATTNIGELRFSQDILALEERRTVVAEKMLDEFRESNRIKRKRVEFNRIKMEYAIARAKRKKESL